MSEFISFLTEYYYIFIILALLLLFALIGYFIDLKHPEENDIDSDNALSDAEVLKRQIAERGNNSIGSFMNKQGNGSDNVISSNSTDTIISSSSSVESLDMGTDINKPQ